MFVPDSRKNLFLCYSWLVIYIEHLIQMEAWKRAVIRADRNRWNTCFLLLLLLFLFFFLFLRVFFIPIAWQSTSGSYQGYMRPKQWNKEKKDFFFLYYFDNVDFVWELLICAVVRSLLVVLLADLFCDKEPVYVTMSSDNYPRPFPMFFYPRPLRPTAMVSMKAWACEWRISLFLVSVIAHNTGWGHDLMVGQDCITLC